MSISDKILKNLPPKQRSYWTKAQEFVTKMQPDWEIVEVDTTEFKAWVRYFRKQGFKPHMLTLVERKVIDKISVPAQFPEMFDQSYVDSGGLDVEWKPFPGFVQPVHPNLFVGRGRPGYDRVLEFVRDATQNFWRHKPSGRHRDDEYLSDEARLLEGYWVPQSWYASGRSYEDWHLRRIKNPGFRKWDNAEKRRAHKPTMTDEEKAAFLDDARRIGGEIKGMTLSHEARGEKIA